MKHPRLYGLIFFIIMLTGCSGINSNKYANAQSVHIERFDSTLYAYLDKAEPQTKTELEANYHDMLDILAKSLFKVNSSDPDFYRKLISYYAEPTLWGLYTDALSSFSDINHIEQELGSGFAFFENELNNFQIPQLYMHVSGLQQNILVGNDIISLSIDKYLGGENYSFYKNYFQPWQLIKMHRSFVAPDYLLGWLMAEYPHEGNDEILLDRMIYAGKLHYLITQALPKRKEQELMGYNQDEYRWLQKNEPMLWKLIIERKHLFTPDRITTNAYFETQPARFLSDEAPANPGTWIGLQIVKQYMKKSGATLQELMDEKDAQQILSASGYRPL
ncbi:gliding motility protein GldB [Parabacteroides sp. OttesenSCG-928-G07]|nr:gliding motility protein GldB [Parabacteroides sp. OttesenSCG-928-G07]